VTGTAIRRLFGFEGRLGRLGFALFLLLAALLAAIPAGLGVLLARTDNATSILAGLALAALLALWTAIALVAQRLHDLDCSGLHTLWLASLTAAAVWLDDPYPALSLGIAALLGLIGLALLLMPGNASENRFGRPSL